MWRSADFVAALRDWGAYAVVVGTRWTCGLRGHIAPGILKATTVVAGISQSVA